MSRIDEALRRSAVVPAAGGGAYEAFSSPWAVGGSVEADAVDGDEGSILAPAGASGGTVALIEGFSPKWRDRLVTSPHADWLFVEQFRKLAATLHQAQTDTGTRTVMITSASTGDGKTLTAINLALTLGESYKRHVLLIDADLRRPSIRDVSDMPNVLGLSDGLRAKNDQRLTVLQLTKQLTLLPAGRPDPDPMSSLTSSRMRRILDDAVRRFDWVIVDAPPVGGIADATLLMAMVDAALLVVRAGETKHPMVKRALDALGRERVLGVVLNGIDRTTQSVYGYGAGYGYENHAQLRAENARG